MKTRLRASAVCVTAGHLLLVRLRDPVTREVALYPPGGGVEPGEAPAETARRETLEETGVRVRVEPASALVDRYPFTWAGVDYDVTTHYFAATPDPPIDPTLPLGRVVDADYNLEALWLPEHDALRALGAHPRIAAAVQSLIAATRSSPSRTTQ